MQRGKPRLKVGQRSGVGASILCRGHIDGAAEIPLEVGLQLQMQAPTGQVVPVTVAAITEETVTLDANHMLAGKDLTFAIELVSIN